MSNYNFEAAAQAWQRIPVDDIGYLPAGNLMGWPNERLQDLALLMGAIRYDPQGWRNWQNGWREFLGLDSTQNKLVMDFGCGFGLDALQFAKTGNAVFLADINMANILLAFMVLRAHGHTARGFCPIVNDPPFFRLSEPVDVIYAAGVLHHTPNIGEILRAMMASLRPGGEIRVLLYSDRRWTQALGGEPLPPIDADVSLHPRFMEFVRHMDAVGEYADWYTPAKLALRLGDAGRIDRWRYIGSNEEFLGAVILPT